MKVTIGNPFAIEGYRIEQSDDPDRVHYRSIEGERETFFDFPETVSVTEAIIIINETLPHHMDLGKGTPAWIESDDALLKKMLCQQYGVSDKKRRPAKWGDGTNGPYGAKEEG